MSFKPNPKAQVENKFYELFGSRLDVEVKGYRPTPLEAKTGGVPKGHFVAEIFCKGQLVARTTATDWRKAYKLLKGKVEGAYADGYVIPGELPGGEGEVRA